MSCAKEKKEKKTQHIRRQGCMKGIKAYSQIQIFDFQLKHKSTDSDDL